MPNCYGYVRVSSQDQYDNGQSLQAQQDILADWYRRNVDKEKWEGFRVYVDGGVSAFKKHLPDRPEGRRMLGALKKGDTIVFTKLDRAFRNIADGNLTLGYLQKKGMRVIFLDMGGSVIDVTTSLGFITINSMLIGAQFESLQKSDRMKATYKHLKDTRGFGTRSLPGYDSFRTGHRTLVQKKSESAIENAKKYMRILVKQGKKEAYKALWGGEIKMEKRLANGSRESTDYRKCHSPSEAIKKAYIRALSILYYTHELVGFCKEIGVPATEFLNIKEKKYRSPATGRWFPMHLPEWNHDYDISGTAA